jgi:hypothetical protein
MPQIALELTKLRRREFFSEEDDVVCVAPTSRRRRDEWIDRTHSDHA